MKVTIKKIGPEEAKKILEERNPYNYRTINMGTVEIYAKDMENGNWMKNGEPIMFDINGNLINGQHRIMAIIKSGTEQWFVIVEELDPSVASTIDIGRKRSIEQYLKWADKGYKTGSTGVVQQVMVFDKHCKHVGQSAQNSKISHMDIVDEYQRDYSGYNEAAQFAKRVNKESNKIIKPKEAGGIYYFLTKRLGWSADIVNRFFFNLYTSPRNDGGIYGNTMKELSGEGTKFKKVKPKGKDRIELFILCFNAMVNGCEDNRKKYSDFFLSSDECKPRIKKVVRETVMV